MAIENIGVQIKRLREAKGISKYRLSKLSGLGEAYLGQLEKGKVNNPRRDILAALAKGLDVEPSVFFNGDEMRSPQSTLSDLELSIGAYIPVYGEVSAGEGIEPIDYVACTMIKKAPDSYRAFRVKGLCLEPYIKDGDTLIVDTARKPNKGDFVIVKFKDKASVKIYREIIIDHISEASNIKAPFHWLENNIGRYKINDANIIGVVVEFNRKMKSYKDIYQSEGE